MTNLLALEQKIEGLTNAGMSNQSLCNIELLSSNVDCFKSQAWWYAFIDTVHEKKDQVLYTQKPVNRPGLKEDKHHMNS